MSSVKSSGVADFIRRKPDVFRFLWRILYAQAASPARFVPLPPIWSQSKTTKGAAAVGTAAVELSNKNISAMRAVDGWVQGDNFARVILPDDATLIALIEFAAAYPIQLAYEPYTCGGVSWIMYKVTASAAAEAAFVQPGKRPDYLYHGSRVNNWHSIIHNGLQVTSKTAWMTTGAVYGDGVYCSDRLSVSQGYSTSACGSEDWICGVYEIYDAKQFEKNTSYFVVPEASRLMLRYLLWVPVGTMLSPLDDALREMWDKRALGRSNASAAGAGIRQRRIERETDLLVRAGFDPVRVTYPARFPADAPAVDGIQVKDWTVRSSVVTYIKK